MTDDRSIKRHEVSDGEETGHSGPRDIRGNSRDFSQEIEGRRKAMASDLPAMRERFREMHGENPDVPGPINNGFVVIPSGQGSLDALANRLLPFVTPTSDLAHLVMSSEPITMSEADDIRDRAEAGVQREKQALEDASPENAGEVVVGENVAAELLGIGAEDWEAIKASSLPLGSGLEQLALESSHDDLSDGERSLQPSENYICIRIDSEVATRDLTAASALGLQAIQRVPDAEDWVLASAHTIPRSDVRGLWRTRHLDPMTVNETAGIRTSTHLGDEVYLSLHPCILGSGSDIKSVLDVAEKAGYHFIDLDPRLLLDQIGDVEEIREALYSRNLRISSLKFPVNFRTYSTDDYEKSLADFRDRILPLFVEGLGVCKFNSYLPPVNAGTDRHYRKVMIVDRLKWINCLLQSYDVSLALEWMSPLHLREGKEGCVYNMGQAVELLSEVDDEFLNIGLLVDFFQCHVAGCSSEDVANLPANSIVHVHVNDAPDVPLDEQRNLERCVPGEGVVDVHAYIEAVRATGYRGTMATEIFGTDLHHLPPVQAAKRARAQVLDAIEGC